MSDVTIEVVGDDAHAFDYFVMGRDTGRLYPDDLTEGDVVEYQLTVTELTLSADSDDSLANDGRPTGMHYSDDVYRGEVVNVGEDSLQVKRYCNHDSMLDAITYDQLHARLF